MNNAGWFSVIAWGLLGAVLLIFLHRLAAGAFPKPSSRLFHAMLAAQQPPTEESGDGMAEVYALDAALMDAELEQPGSTFWLYYRQPGAVFGRWTGSLLISLMIASWAFGVGRLTCGSFILLLVGVGLSAYTYQTWWMSRPALKEN